MMIVFTGASAKALGGIRNIFGTVYVQPLPNGRFNVVAHKREQVVGG